MKKIFWLLVLLPTVVLAQSPFNGTWVMKQDSAQLPKKPESYLLQKGRYECSSCVPKLKVNADGKDHHVAGSPYFSTISIKILDPGKLQIIEKQSDKTVYSETDTVSSDGQTLTQELTDTGAPNGKPIIAKETLQKIAPGPSGSDPISGSWQAQKVRVLSENGVTVTYHETENGLQALDPGGEGYDAKFDGRDYMLQGDPDHCSVSLRRVDANTICEAEKLAGLVHYEVCMSVSPDGKSMNVTETDKERGTTMSYVMEKKSP